MFESFRDLESFREFSRVFESLREFERFCEFSKVFESFHILFNESTQLMAIALLMLKSWPLFVQIQNHFKCKIVTLVDTSKPNINQFGKVLVQIGLTSQNAPIAICAILTCIM